MKQAAGDCECLIDTEEQFRSMDHFSSLKGLLFPFFPPFWLSLASSFSVLCNLYPQSLDSNVSVAGTHPGRRSTVGDRRRI